MARRELAFEPSNALADAQHEAAHVVVGVALGLRLYRASVRRERRGDDLWLGYAQFMPGPREAEIISIAAGVAWERRVGDIVHARTDLDHLRKEYRIRGNARLATLERAAWAVLETRAGVHARVTRALLDGDLDHKSLRALWAEKEPY